MPRAHFKTASNEVISDLRVLVDNWEQAARERKKLEGTKRDWVSGVSHASLPGPSQAADERHNPPGTEIHVGVRAQGAGYRVVVADNGNGMSRAQQERLFTRYYRDSKQPAPDHIGGLGLVVVKNIVEAHGGRIDVNSAEGEGSRFAVFLNKAPALEVE